MQRCPREPLGKQGRSHTTAWAGSVVSVGPEQPGVWPWQLPQTALTLCLSCTPSRLYPRSPTPCVSADLRWAIRESHPLSSTSCLGRQGPLPDRAGIRFQHLACTPGDCPVGPHKPTAARLSFPPLGDTRPTLGSGHTEGRRMTGPHATWVPEAQDWSGFLSTAAQGWRTAFTGYMHASWVQAPALVSHDKSFLPASRMQLPGSHCKPKDVKYSQTNSKE